MNEITQTDMSNNALVSAIQANIGDLFRHLSKSASDEGYEDGNFTRWHTPIAHPWFSGLLCTTLPTKGGDAFIAESIQYFRKKKVDTFSLWLGPHLKLSDWESVLIPHGFRISKDTPGMAVDLHALNESTKTADSFEVRPAADEESIRTWARIFTQGYGLPLAWENHVFDLWMKLGLDFPVRNYLGYLNGEPVATSCLFLGGGAAGIYSVATLPEARGKGIGAAVTIKPLQDARDMGYRIGVLQSSEMGYSIYKRLGFQHLCQMEYFYLSLP
jgi:ribosomal protein S18 acetylase RimI-like enzyme